MLYIYMFIWALGPFIAMYSQFLQRDMVKILTCNGYRYSSFYILVVEFI